MATVIKCVFVCYLATCSVTINSTEFLPEFVMLLNDTHNNLYAEEPALQLNNSLEAPNEELNLFSNISQNEAEHYKHQYSLGSNNEDIHLNITQLIKKYGYKAEQYETRTDDGYVLTMFRIPRNGPVVFLMHGLLSSADEWITPGPESGIGYLLSKEGYDVWMGNARGNKHSRRHVHLSPEKDQEKFWDFSWDEIGRLDLPAMIDFVLKVTQVPNIKYIGHSQGTTSFFVMTSERPDYNDKISLMVALSPVAWMSHVKSPLARRFAPFVSYGPLLAKITGVYEMLPSSSFIKSVQRTMCRNIILAQLICANILFLMAGFNYKQLNVTNLPVILAHVPSGASTKQMIHYGQLIISGHFRKFDYGANKNLQRYHSLLPPNYEVKRVTTPVALFYSSEDWLSNVTDVDILMENLPNVVDSYLVPDKKFNHLDFIFAKDLKTLIYNRISKLFQKF